MCVLKRIVGSVLVYLLVYSVAIMLTLCTEYDGTHNQCYVYSSKTLNILLVPTVNS